MASSQQKELSDFTSPAGTPTQIWSTAALFLPTYVCAERETIIPLHEAFKAKIETWRRQKST